ncbi:DUF6455 family protein [Desertibaculum subflavum]|uniref:DUF6455 family protein n=1 Tax=Desertibaculum subflavum TaxID=2268458 RepID=UPI0013C4486D
MARSTNAPHRESMIAGWLADAKAAFAAARRRRAERAELSHLPAGDRDRILHDLGEPPGDISFVSRAQPCAATLMAGMMKFVGVDPRDAEAQGLVLRDLQRTCAECREWRRCRYWQAGEIKDDPRDFCLNTPTFDALKHEKVQASARG